MSSVIELAKFRKSQTYEEQHKNENRYFCLKCDSQGLFKLWASGAVTCSECGSLISNLTTSYSPPAA